jgi:hypothetical protein
MLDPVSVVLKFGFLIVLYLFLLWIARSAMKDLRGGAVREEDAVDATGMHAASSGLARTPSDGMDPRLRIERAAGLRSGDEYDLLEGVTIGRGDAADIRLEDPFASSRHCRIVRQGELLVLEDLNSTNGTFLNGEEVRGPQPLHPGDRISIGDNEFEYMA